MPESTTWAASGRASAGCTIISPNYLSFARTLAVSYRAQHPDHPFFVLLVADLVDSSQFAQEPFQAVVLSEIGLQDLRGEAMKYEILELNTNVKPTFMKYLMERFGLERLVYLDPDIFCYAPLEPVWQALEENDAVLTPHMTSPVFDGKVPGEQELLYNGTYNLGFIAVRRSPDGLRLLDWWERRCLDLGFSEGRTGLFVDQKWMNLAPGLFERVKVLRHRGCNMAYWNLHDRVLSRSDAGKLLVNGAEPLCFFHFSGIDVQEADGLSKHTDRYTLETRPDLRELFAAYRATVLANKDDRLEALAYGFDQLSDGTAITRLARRMYAMHWEHFSGSDPFEAQGPFARFARRAGLVAGKVTLKKATWKEFSPIDRRVQAIHRLLRLALRLLGPHRYELLMRYLGHITVLRHQSVFLVDGLPQARRPR